MRVEVYGCQGTEFCFLLVNLLQCFTQKVNHFSLSKGKCNRQKSNVMTINSGVSFLEVRGAWALQNKANHFCETTLFSDWLLTNLDPDLELGRGGGGEGEGGGGGGKGSCLLCRLFFPM